MLEQSRSFDKPSSHASCDQSDFDRTRAANEQSTFGLTNDMVVAVYQNRVDQLQQRGFLRYPNEIVDYEEQTDHWDDLSRVYQQTRMDMLLPVVQEGLSQLSREQLVDTITVVDRVQEALWVRDSTPKTFPIARIGFELTGQPGAVVVATSSSLRENFLYNYVTQAALSELDHKPPERLFGEYNAVREAIVMVQKPDFSITTYRLAADDGLIAAYQNFGHFSLT